MVMLKRGFGSAAAVAAVAAIKSLLLSLAFSSSSPPSLSPSALSTWSRDSRASECTPFEPSSSSFSKSDSISNDSSKLKSWVSSAPEFGSACSTPVSSLECSSKLALSTSSLSSSRISSGSPFSLVSDSGLKLWFSEPWSPAFDSMPSVVSSTWASSFAGRSAFADSDRLSSNWNENTILTHSS